MDKFDQLDFSSASLFYEIQQSFSDPHLPIISSTESCLILPPTGHSQAISPFPGTFQFAAEFTPFAYENWEFSNVLNKLYADMDKWIQVKFHFATQPPHGLYMRALPVYTDAAHLKTTVKDVQSTPIQTTQQIQVFNIHNI